MANRFWVGGGSANTWIATTNTNWATTSGGANNASVPGTSDFVIFDANSGTGNSVISASIAVQGVDCTGYTGTLTHNTAVTLTINTAATNAFRLVSGMTYAPASVSSIVTFTNTTGTAVLTSGGKVLNGVAVNGSGGTVQQFDNLSINGIQNATLTITTGVFDCNSNSLTVPILSASNSNTRSLLLGSGITVGGNVATGQTPWGTATTTGLTFTLNSCPITVLSPTGTILNQTLAFGTLTLGSLTINSTTSGVLTSLTANTTMTTLSVGSGNTLFVSGGNTITSNAFTFVGTPSMPIGLISSNGTTSATFSCSSGSCSLTWGILFNCVGSGGATFTATNTVAMGTRTGWSITPPASLTAAAVATAVWEDTFAGGDFATAGSAGLLLSNMQNVGNTAQAIGRGTVTGSPSTTSLPTSAFTPATSGSVANQLVGRVVLFDAATTTTALRGQAATISASSASATPTLTVSALTATPASGDTFSVI